MKFTNINYKKLFIITAGSFLLILLAIVLLISPLSKHLIEKYDEKYTGRKIKTGWVYVNPFTGFIYIKNLRIYESRPIDVLEDVDSVFISAKSLSVNFAMLKLFARTIEITSVTLNQPKGIVIQNRKEFNFNDIIKKYTPEKPDSTPSAIHFSILNIKIKKGEFRYVEQSIPVSYSIKEANFESPGMHWKKDTMAIKFSFLPGTGTGSAKGDFTLNFKNLEYRINTNLLKFDLKFIEQYITDFVNFGTFRANLDADINAAGNFNDKENINVKGMLVMNDFHFGKNQDDDYASFDKLELSINEMNPKNHIYLFDSLSLSHPYLKYEQYDYLDNLRRMVGSKGSTIAEAGSDRSRFNLVLEIADYVKVLAKNFFQSDYKIDKLAIYYGCLTFNDYSTTEKFSIEASPLFVFADSVSKTKNWVEILIKSGINPYGDVLVNLRINPKDSGDFDLKYHLQSLPVSIFNPYLITYTSFPFDRGTIELKGAWKVRQGIIKSNNHLLVIDPRLTNRIRNRDTKWLPSPLMMFFIQERGNVIDYEIPISGNLKDPRFHLKDVIFDVLGNIFVKPPTTPYRTQIKTIENEIEKTLTLKWEMRQNSLQPNQEVFVSKMADYLISNPEATIDIYPVQYAEKEKEYILFFEAKKKYFLFIHDKNAQKFTEDDSLKVDKMSVNETSFVHYLNKQVNDSMLFTLQDKCKRIVNRTLVDSKFNQLIKAREDAFLSEFKKKNLDKRLKINPNENGVPYNGFSFYKINYNDEYPEVLIKAYRQMNEFNEVAPRKKFEKDRKKNENDM